MGKNENKLKCLIISGGTVDYTWAHNWLQNRSYDYVIAADRGLVHADYLGIKVNYILGDYDSVNQEVLDRYRGDTDVVTYPCEKDYTDTHIAVLTAIRKGATQIDLIGATGSRYDHAMTNVFVMKQALDAGVSCTIYDPSNKIYLLDSNIDIGKNEQYGRYISLIPMTELVKVTLIGAKYPLQDYELVQGLSICQSNEIKEDVLNILIKKGIVIIFETND